MLSHTFEFSSGEVSFSAAATDEKVSFVLEVLMVFF
jgi:hypothetical protein